MGKIEKRIVLTGGPCAGKTTALSRIEEDLTEKGYHVLVVSESATELIKGGIRPFGTESLSMIDFQRLIIPYQLQKENIYDAAVDLLPTDAKCVLVYDRGIMDNRAYITKEEFEQVITPLGLHSLELLDRYDMVLHLVTAADGKEEYYSLENNNARTETVSEAIAMDKKSMNAWSGHNRLTIIDNTTQFEEKMDRVLSSIHNLLGMPVSLKQQKMFVIDLEKSDPRYDQYTKIEIEQYYLSTNDSDTYERRLRKRSQEDTNTYYFTVQKRGLNGESKIITDKKVTEKEFERLMNLYTVESYSKKVRYCFVRDKQYFKLDLHENCPLSLLQIDTTEANPTIHFPEELCVEKEVTNDLEYQNRQISSQKNGKEKKLNEGTSKCYY